MSDETDEKTPDNIRTFTARENPEASQLPASEASTYDQELMYQEYLRGVTMTQIAENWKEKVSYRTVQRYKEKFRWDERKEKDLALKAFLSESETDTIARETYTKLLKVCYRLVSDLERSVFDADAEEQARSVPLKTITDAVEKLTKLHYFAQAGGVDKKSIESKHTQVNVDYAEMAKIYMKAKTEGVDYDAKAHMKDVIDGKFKRVKDE